jgi:hypothetical protein
MTSLQTAAERQLFVKWIKPYVNTYTQMNENRFPPDEWFIQKEQEFIEEQRVAQDWEREDKIHGAYYPPHLVEEIVGYVRPHLHIPNEIRAEWHKEWINYLDALKQRHPELEKFPLRQNTFYINGDPEDTVAKFLGGFPALSQGGVQLQIRQQRLFDEFQRRNQDELQVTKEFLDYSDYDKPHERKEPENRDPFAPEKGSEIGESNMGSGMSGGKYHIKHVPYGYKVCKLHEKKCFSKHPLDLERAKSQMRALYANTKKGGSYDYNRSMFPYMAGPSDAARQQMDDTQRYKPFSY